MPRKSKNKASSSLTTSPFQREIQIPGKALGIVIGKGGSTLKSFKQIPGISSVNCSSNGKFQIHADSQQALETVVASVEQLVSFSLDKNNGYFPDFFAFCFCKSIQDPTLAINKVFFQTFSNDISNLTSRDTASRRSFFCIKSAEHCQDSTSGPQDEIDILSEELAEKTSKVFFRANWDTAAYRANLKSCLEPLFFHRNETMRYVKIAVRFGKQLFYGRNWSELQSRDFMPLERLQSLCRQELLDQRFSTACSDSAIKDLKVLHLQTLGYQKGSSRRKITIHVADLRHRHLQFNVSVRCEGSEGFGEKISITRVRNQPVRHGFVIFCREGSAKTDFRLGVISHGTDMDAIPEMVEWIEKAWRSRTPDGLLVFDPSARFLVMNIRYKDADTYVRDDWKLRIAEVRDGDRSKVSNRRDCVLSSRWFKRNVDIIGEDGIDSAVENVEALVKEAAKLSHLMDAK